MATMPSIILGGHSFAERLRRVGAEFELEVRQAAEAAVQSAQREARLLRDEVEWLQRQLEDERHQSAVRLGLCAELKRQIEELQDAHHQEAEAREYWQRECASFEEKHSLLEAKLAAMVLSEEEAMRGPAAGLPAATDAGEKMARGTNRSPKAADEQGVAFAEPADTLAPTDADEDSDNAGESCEDAEVLAAVVAGEPRAVERHLRSLEDGGHVTESGNAAGGPVAFAALERCLGRFGAKALHPLLVAATRRREGAGVLLHRIVQMWVGHLLAFNGGAVVRTAIALGSQEALRALIALGGPSVVRAAVCHKSRGDGEAKAAAGRHSGEAASDDATSSPCALRLCVERSDPELLAPLLEGLRGASYETLDSVREAHDLAVAVGRPELVAPLATHLVVELSLLGNSQYRRGEFEPAIDCYTEAINLCEEGGREGSLACQLMVESGCRVKENLVRLRYNLARALHRTDRWSEARGQATEVLQLDPNYVNAYALRAQAAMSALDWMAAQADWDRLMSLCATTAPSGASSRSGAAGDEVVNAWQRRREECNRQISMGHYEVLELPRLASTETVKRSYRDLARRWHPDKHQHKSRDHQDRASRRFNRIREAYEVLSDDAAKRAYDAVLLLREARPLTPGHEQGDGPNGAGSECGHAAGNAGNAGQYPEDPPTPAMRRASDPGRGAYFPSAGAATGGRGNRGSSSSGGSSVGSCGFAAPSASPRERGNPAEFLRGGIGVPTSRHPMHGSPVRGSHMPSGSGAGDSTNGRSSAADATAKASCAHGGSGRSGRDRDRSLGGSDDGLLGFFTGLDWAAGSAQSSAARGEDPTMAAAFSESTPLSDARQPRWPPCSRASAGTSAAGMLHKVNLFDPEFVGVDANSAAGPGGAGLPGSQRRSPQMF